VTEQYCTRCFKRYPAGAAGCPEHGDTLARFADRDLVGETLDGRYRVVSVIGKGGMGVVYRAVQDAIDRPVALKVLNREIVQDETAIKRFLIEAKAMASLRSPHAIMLYDFGATRDGLLYYTMEELDGRPLSRLLQEQAPLDYRRAASLVFQACDALEDAHDRGICHRDIKPDNLFITHRGRGDSEFLVVLDFGIAKLRGGGSSEAVTRTGMVIGTPGYLSPEQVTGGEVTPASDLYSLGIVFYEMLAGAVPFRANTAVQVLMMHVNEEPRPVTATNPAVRLPPPVEAVLRRALAKKPEQRFRSAGELRTALEAALGEAAQPQTATLSSREPTPAGMAVPGSAATPAGMSARGSVATAAGIPAPAAVPVPRSLASRLAWPVAALAGMAAVGLAVAFLLAPDPPGADTAAQQPATPAAVSQAGAPTTEAGAQPATPAAVSQPVSPAAEAGPLPAAPAAASQPATPAAASPPARPAVVAAPAATPAVAAAAQAGRDQAQALRGQMTALRERERASAAELRTLADQWESLDDAAAEGLRGIAGRLDSQAQAADRMLAMIPASLDGPADDLMQGMQRLLADATALDTEQRGVVAGVTQRLLLRADRVRQTAGPAVFQLRAAAQAWQYTAPDAAMALANAANGLAMLLTRLDTEVSGAIAGGKLLSAATALQEIEESVSVILDAVNGQAAPPSADEGSY
jgi:serine/threonine-protein kinase